MPANQEAPLLPSMPTRWAPTTSTTISAPSSPPTGTTTSPKPAGQRAIKYVGKHVQARDPILHQPGQLRLEDRSRRVCHERLRARGHNLWERGRGCCERRLFVGFVSLGATTGTRDRPDLSLGASEEREVGVAGADRGAHCIGLCSFGGVDIRVVLLPWRCVLGSKGSQSYSQVICLCRSEEQVEKEEKGEQFFFGVNVRAVLTSRDAPQQRGRSDPCTAHSQRRRHPASHTRGLPFGSSDIRGEESRDPEGW